MTSVRLDVSVHSRLSAAASMAGKDKSRFIAELIADALRGLVIIDRRGGAGGGDPGPSDLAPSDESTQ
jgi:predicted transcriptional regulator